MPSLAGAFFTLVWAGISGQDSRAALFFLFFDCSSLTTLHCWFIAIFFNPLSWLILLADSLGCFSWLFLLAVAVSLAGSFGLIS